MIRKCFYPFVWSEVLQKQTLREDLRVCGTGKEADEVNMIRQVTRIWITNLTGDCGGRAEHTSELTHWGRSWAFNHPAQQRRLSRPVLYILMHTPQAGKSLGRED